MAKNVQIDESWYKELSEEFKKTYFAELKEFLIAEKQKYTIYPPGAQIFSAFNRTPFEKVKVVIIGQDPYHGPGQAHGLCFSVPHGIQPPPSLKNIFKEISNDLNIPLPNHGNLEKWADQGVFLLNATLTVRANSAGSHQKKGWEIFTDIVISTISQKRENIVFMLWGRYAQNKEQIIDQSKHLILKTVHPSPLSAHSGFFGSKHFSKANKYLIQNNIKQIDWEL